MDQGTVLISKPRKEQANRQITSMKPNPVSTRPFLHPKVFAQAGERFMAGAKLRRALDGG
jgi:hypothetical protein